MLEKMFTTKMSMDKKKLQNRFSKIRSKNGKTSKFIALAVFAVIIVSIICVSIWVAVSRQDDTTVNSDIKLTFNGEIISFQNDPYIFSETLPTGFSTQTMAFFPLEELCQKLGAECEKNLNEAVIKIPGANDNYRISLGKNEIYYESLIGASATRETKTAPEAKNSTLYIPYEFIEYIFIDGNNYDIFGSTLYKNETMNVQFEIPMLWLGKYIADETTVNDEYIAFKHKGIAEKHDGMGTLFSVMKMPDPKIEEHIGMVGGTIVWQNQDYAYLIGRPTDVQVPIWEGNDKEDVVFADEYERMSKGITHIESTFSLINDIETPVITNAENMSYAQMKDLQRQVDNGHFPWRLDYEQVMQMYLSGMGESVENGKLTYFAGDGEDCVGTYDMGDKRYTLELFKPEDKSEHGIWIVRSVKEISNDILKEVFFYDCTPYERMIERLGNWYRVPQIITASFSWFEVGKEPYPTSVTAYFTPTGTEMDEYKKEIGKIKAPFSYRTMAQTLGMKIQFPDDATTGQLRFVFDYKDGTSETSEFYNILVDKMVEYNGQTGILIRDEVLFADASQKEKITDVKANDLVYVFYESNDSYYVQLPVMSIPPTEGYIKLDSVSFDEKLFLTANHGRVASGSHLYNSASSKSKHSVQEFSEVVEILERKNGFALCSFPGGKESKWVELRNIQFKLK